MGDQELSGGEMLGLQGRMNQKQWMVDFSASNLESVPRSNEVDK